MSTVDVDPSTLFGGTWERIKDTFLLAAGDSYSAGSTGGSVNHTHSNPNTGSWNGTSGSTAITTAQMPSHSHTIAHTHTFSGTTSQDGLHSHPTQGWKGANGDGQAINRYYQSADPIDYNSPILSSGNHTHTYSGTTSGSSAANSGSNGSGQGHTHSIPSHTHTVGNTGSSSNMPPYLTVYCWRRTA